MIRFVSLHFFLFFHYPHGKCFEFDFPFICSKYFVFQWKREIDSNYSGAKVHGCVTISTSLIWAALELAVIITSGWNRRIFPQNPFSQKAFIRLSSFIFQLKSVRLQKIADLPLIEFNWGTFGDVRKTTKLIHDIELHPVIRFARKFVYCGSKINSTANYG